jgi:hypothetical protein
MVYSKKKDEELYIIIDDQPERFGELVIDEFIEDNLTHLPEPIYLVTEKDEIGDFTILSLKEIDDHLFSEIQDLFVSDENDEFFELIDWEYSHYR